MTESLRQPLLQLLKDHAHLETHHEDGDSGNFISGWQCNNSVIGMIDSVVRQERETLTGARYYYLEDDDLSKDRILTFHHTADSQYPEGLLPGMGSTPILSAFCAYLRECDTTSVYYLPPLYFSMHATLRSFGIEAVPIAERHGFEAEFDPRLPKKRCVLLMCDPVWYAGKHLPVSFIEHLSDWQAATGSLVFIDGSFQYTNWDGSMHEATSRLDPSSTIRLVCPTKALASHGYRFAYALVPASIQKRLAHTLNRVQGSCSIDSIAMARAAPQLISVLGLGKVLMRQAARNHCALRENNSIGAIWNPDCGYFTFERLIDPALKNTLTMGGEYFEQHLYDGYARINLLSPSLNESVSRFAHLDSAAVA